MVQQHIFNKHWNKVVAEVTQNIAASETPFTYVVHHVKLKVGKLTVYAKEITATTYTLHYNKCSGTNTSSRQPETTSCKGKRPLVPV